MQICGSDGGPFGNDPVKGNNHRSRAKPILIVVVTQRHEDSVDQRLAHKGPKAFSFPNDFHPYQYKTHHVTPFH